ncbi:MAG: LLM class flavin-dependent oxidoreductase [Ectothiorhodospiraceae bacterium]|nr:LLM class flavin-dependent oxidoreductase [Chromatiales bacterium]MCP5154393.1 LLM class flavin-dependent oxidoreductase [Ectothiorhodospiraceae bacterium]
MSTALDSRRRPLKVGVQLPEAEREVRWRELADMARVAEAIGIDGLWLGDHLLYRAPHLGTRGPWEAWSTLAALAAITERVTLGPLVAATAFHSPAMLAKKAATVDEVSDGRLVLGLGAGWNAVEFAAFGFPFDHRVSRFEEAFTIVRTLLAEGAVDFEGRFHSARECELLPRGPRPGGIPLMVGSRGPRMLGITLPHVSAWNAWYTWFGNCAEGYPSLRDDIDAACRSAGREPSAVARTVALLVRFPESEARDHVNPTGVEVPPLPSDPDTLAEALRAFARLGVSEVQLVLEPITVSAIARLAPVLERLDASP